MNKTNLNTPEGTRDIIFGEVSLYTDITDRLSRVFESNGFRRVSTPAVEYYDVFDADKSIRQESMYKLTDMNGRLIVLRADNTTPMARVAATKLKGMDYPRKLYYNQRIYRINDGWSGRRSEILQCGIEIIGAAGIKSDLICINTAIQSLAALGLDYKIELGHVGYYNAMIKELGLSEAERRRLRSYVERKNLEKISAYDKISKIPLLYGGDEVFEDARILSEGNDEASEALEYVGTLYETLREAGYGEHVMVDMGIVHDIDYYTGTVFRGYIEDAGEPVLAGGRYDNLMRSFGEDCPATGFAINICLVADAVLKRDGLSDGCPVDYIIHFDKDSFAAAECFRRQLEAKYIRCEYSCFDNADETISFAERMSVPNIAVADRNGISVIKTGEG
ncbi:MAG: ATP phosphoribosyltransferase regulatory subunit [Eubacteriales bacterium]|jgi:ATP phosphoribosyltransferase regulatory subunit|nr:ATP phosphoribosyltransferase regulatory subunit [Eubacteriales bacterium]